MGSPRKTVILKVDPKRPDKDILNYAAAALKGGRLVAFPTETVYGVGANALDRRAVAGLARAKKRPIGKPFAIAVSDIGYIRKMGFKMCPRTARLIKRYWPGPLTVILRSAGGLKTGFRMPDCPVALGIIKSAGVPVALPSANISGNTPPKTAGAVLRNLAGRIDIVIDAGPTRIGSESTVVDMTGPSPRILRDGAIKRKAIFKITGDGQQH